MVTAFHTHAVFGFSISVDGGLIGGSTVIEVCTDIKTCGWVAVSVGFHYTIGLECGIAA